MNFYASMIFVPLWLALPYPVAHIPFGAVVPSTSWASSTTRAAMPSTFRPAPQASSIRTGLGPAWPRTARTHGPTP